MPEDRKRLPAVWPNGLMRKSLTGLAGERKREERKKERKITFETVVGMDSLRIYLFQHT